MSNNPFIEYAIDTIKKTPEDQEIVLLFRGALVAKTEIIPILDEIGDRKTILVLEDPAEGQIFKAIVRLLHKKDNVEINTFIDLENGDLDFNLENAICIMNPPYSGTKHLSFLNNIIDLGCKEIICVHPSTYLLDRKNKKDIYLSTKNKLQGKVKECKFLDGNVVFGIQAFLPYVYIHYDYLYSGDVNIEYMGDNYVSDIHDITVYGSRWSEVAPIYERIINVDSIDDNKITKSQIDDSKFHCKFPSIRGNAKDIARGVKGTFYSLLDENNGINIDLDSIRQKKDTDLLLFQFTTEKERDNFVKYSKTYFFRFCLSFYKIGGNVHRGELKCVPWLDFTQEWDDEKLFKHFNINKKTQKYIYEFLPDYYGLLKK